MRWIEAKSGDEVLRVPMARLPISVGRSADCDFSFPNDKQVSRVHAVLEPRTNGWFVVDNKSTNGSYVNGQRVTVPFPIKDGDMIEIGGQTLRVCTGLHMIVPENYARKYAGYPHYYIILKVHPSADMATILRAYGELRTIFDPKLHPDNSKVKECLAEVEEAFGILGDLQKRKEYDAILPPDCFALESESASEPRLAMEPDAGALDR